MNAKREYDVMITGAGPAGISAAVGLRRLGYTVALLERQAFPRAHIGEALTPGVPDILEFLGLGDVLARVPAIETAGTLRVWDRRNEATQLPPGGGLVADRASFDQALLRAASERDIDCYRHLNTVPERDGEGSFWKTAVARESGDQTIAARLWIDARGRQPAQPSSYIQTAPAAIAMWAEFACDAAQDSRLSRVEALHDAWLWGAPTTAGTYRVLAVSDPCVPRSLAPGSPSTWLREALARSTLLRSYAGEPLAGRLGHCAAGPYVHADPWQTGFMKAGDAAFALDPLSSAGVEKAMRHALQCVVAAHTLLDDSRDEEIARGFYVDRLLESVANHACWTERHYGDAWAAREEVFWQDRAEARVAREGSDLAAMLAARLASVRATPAAEEPQGAAHPDEDLARQVLSRQTSVVLSPMARKVETLCVVGDKAVAAPAVSHPSLPRPVAFLDGIAVTPMLPEADKAINLHALVARWSTSMPRRRAMQIACWLLEEEILIAC